MTTLPYRKKGFQVHDTRDSCTITQKHDLDEPPRVIATFERTWEWDYKKNG
jgi:hypothetical protein